MVENIKITYGNFSGGPNPALYYYVNFGANTLNAVTSNGTGAGSWFVTNAQLRNPVKELHYDGTFFWTLEDLPSDLGIVIKKWRLYPVKTATFPDVSPSEFRWQDELTLIHGSNIRYASSAFAIEHFHRTFQISADQGDSSITLNNTSKLSVGDVLYLGPSTDAPDFDGVEEEIIVGGISGNVVSFSKSGGLEASYFLGDPVDFIRGIWIFNDHTFTGTEDNVGTLQRFAYPRKNRTLVAQNHVYYGVSAADFDGTILSFVRGDQIMDHDIDNPTFDLGSSLEANLREADKRTSIEVFDLISDKSENAYYKLQQKETSDDGVTSDWNDRYNFQLVSSVSRINSTALSFDQRFTLPDGTGDTIAVEAQVRDQFNFPALDEQVQFSASVSVGIGSPGTFFPTQSGTNTLGIASTTYTPSDTEDEILVAIRAKVEDIDSTWAKNVEALVSQMGKFEQPDDTSKPIEQMRVSTNNSSSRPIEQRVPVDLGITSDTSKPIEQKAPAEFSPLVRGAAVIEQKAVETAPGSSKPIEQKEFTTSSKPIEQRDISTNDATSRPIEQQEIPTGSKNITQFDFIDLIFPDCGSVKNPVNTNIRWRIKEFSGVDLDAETIIFQVNGFEVQDTSDFTVEDIVGVGLELIYNPPIDFDFDILVTVFLYIQDVANPPNTFEYSCTWQTVPDVRGPTFSEVGPTCYSTDVDVLEPITFEVFDVGNGVDPDSINLSVEGIAVCSGITLAPFTTVSGSGYTVTYNHLDDPFRYDAEITIALEASDLTDPPNSSLFICYFSTEDSEGPLFMNFYPEQCKTFVDNTTGLSFEVYGVEQGVDISTLEVRIDNKLRKVFVRPRLLRDDE